MSDEEKRQIEAFMRTLTRDELEILRRYLMNLKRIRQDNRNQ